MVKKDIPSVLEIENVSFPNPWPATSFMGEIANLSISFPFVIVLKVPERIIGYIIYWKIEEEVQISNIAVHPDFRRMGVGKEVLLQIIDTIQVQGVRFIILEVRPSNLSATSLYEKLGFQVLGIRRNYYTSPAEDAIVMGMML